MSAKTVSSNCIYVVNQKGNKIYDIFAMKNAFSSLYLVFRVFLLILYVLKSVAFTWCEEWVIAAQTNL